MVNFTFHNDSINTEKEVVNQVIKMQSLHSTMFLLIRLGSAVKKISLLIFTFHNVSINTWTRRSESFTRISLHSTMFLLILLGYPVTMQ